MNNFALLFDIVIVITLLVLWFEIGNFLNSKFFGIKTNFILPLGVLGFFAIFHLLTLPICIINGSYNYIEYFVAPIYLVGIIITNYIFFRFHLRDFIYRYKNFYVLLVDATCFFYGLYLLIFSTPYIDSYAFLPLATVSSTSGIIYSNGTDVVTSAHKYDTFYLFLNMLSEFSFSDSFLFLTATYKFIEGVIVISMIGFFIEQMFYKFRYNAFIISFLGLFFWIVPLINSFFNDIGYTPLFLVHMSPTGTAMLYFIVIPFMIFYLINKSKGNHNSLLLLLIILSGLCFSTSIMLIFPFFLVSSVFIDIIVLKKIDKFDTYIPAISVFMFGLIYYGFNPSLIVLFIVALLLIIFAILLKKILTKMPILNPIAHYAVVVSYICMLLFLSMFLDVKIVEIINNVFTNRQLPILYFLGAIIMFKENRSLFYIIVISYFVCSNEVLLAVVDNAAQIIQNVFHRVQMIPSVYLLNIILFAFIMSYICQRRFIYAVCYLGICIYGFINSYDTNIYYNQLYKLNVNNPSSYESFKEYKVRSKEAYHFAQYEFYESDYIYFPPSTPSTPANFDYIIYDNYGLTKVNQIEDPMSDSYAIINNTIELECQYKVVDSYGDYELVYIY